MNVVEKGMMPNLEPQEKKKPLIDAFGDRESAIAAAEKGIAEMLDEQGFTTNDVAEALRRIEKNRKRDVWH